MHSIITDFLDELFISQNISKFNEYRKLTLHSFLLLSFNLPELFFSFSSLAAFVYLHIVASVSICMCLFRWVSLCAYFVPFLNWTLLVLHFISHLIIHPMPEQINVEYTTVSDPVVSVETSMCFIHFMDNKSQKYTGKRANNKTNDQHTQKFWPTALLF